MSAVTTCPKCHRQVALPASDDHSVWVRCPLCHAEYLLKAAVEYAPLSLEVIPEPTAAAAAAFRETALQMGASESSIHAAEPPASEGSSQVDLDGRHALPAVGIEGFGPPAGLEPEQPTFAAAETVADAPFAGEEVPFAAEEEPFVGDDVPIEAEHSHGDGDEGFRFADEGEPLEMSEGDADGEGAHELGSIATMVAAAPPKVKRKVPTSVRLIGLGIFAFVSVFGLWLTYTVFLFFGISDQFGIQKYWPRVLVAKSLQGGAAGTPAKSPSQPTNPAAAPTDQQPAKDDANPAGQNPAQPNPADDKQAAAQPPQPNAEPAKNEPPAAGPPPGDVAQQSPPKSPAATDQIENPLKGAPTETPGFDPTKLDPTKLDPTKIEPPKLDAPKAPAVEPPAAPTPATPEKTPSTPEKPPVAAIPPAVDTTVAPPEKPAPKADVAASEPAAKPPVADTKGPEKAADKLPEAPGPKDQPAATIDELHAAIDAAGKANESVDAAAKTAGSGGVPLPVRIAQYKAMSHLGTVLAEAKGSGVDFDVQLEECKSQASAALARAAISTPEQQASVSMLAGKWIASPSRKESGVLVVGTLEKTAKEGQLYVSQVKLPGSGTEITVATAAKPTVEEGASIVVLGSLVKEPAKNLTGYQGAADTVVWGALAVPPPKAESAASTAAPPK